MYVGIHQRHIHQPQNNLYIVLFETMSICKRKCLLQLIMPVHILHTFVVSFDANRSIDILLASPNSSRNLICCRSVCTGQKMNRVAINLPIASNTIICIRHHFVSSAVYFCCFRSAILDRGKKATPVCSTCPPYINLPFC
jgi:hypothetical protein